MPLQKQPIPITFGQGLETKVDPYQVPMGKFLSLVNSVFTTGGRLTKRNGFPEITILPDALQTTLTTLNDNLIATGESLYAFSPDTNAWLNKGTIQPVGLDTISLVKSSTSQTSPDSAIAPNGLMCLAYMDNSLPYYQIIDSSTGQQVISRVALNATAVNLRVFLLGQYFIVTYIATVSAATHLQYIAIPISTPTSPRTATDIRTTLTSLQAGYDGYVANNNLYLAWSDTGSLTKLAYLTSTLGLATAVTAISHAATQVSVTADTSFSSGLPIIWVSTYTTISTGYSAAYDHILNQVTAPVQSLASTPGGSGITSLATGGVLTLFHGNLTTLGPFGSYSDSFRADNISKSTVNQAGTVVFVGDIALSVTLASKAFYGPSGTMYMLAAYGPRDRAIS